MARLSDIYSLIGNYIEVHGDKDVTSIATHSSSSEYEYTFNLHDIHSGSIGTNPYTGADKLSIPASVTHRSDEKKSAKDYKADNEREEQNNTSTYGISIKEILKRTIIVKAENLMEAIQKVEDAVSCDKICLDADDYDGREIVPSVYFEEGKVPEGTDTSFYWHLGEDE